MQEVAVLAQRLLVLRALGPHPLSPHCCQRTDAFPGRLQLSLNTSTVPEFPSGLLSRATMGSEGARVDHGAMGASHWCHRIQADGTYWEGHQIAQLEQGKQGSLAKEKSNLIEVRSRDRETRGLRVGLPACTEIVSNLPILLYVFFFFF